MDLTEHEILVELKKKVNDLHVMMAQVEIDYNKVLQTHENEIQKLNNIIAERDKLITELKEEKSLKNV